MIQTSPERQNTIPKIHHNAFIIFLLKILIKDINSDYNPNALKRRNRTRTAVIPWKIIPLILPPLNARDLPRTTSAIMKMIQAADISQTMIVAIHHNIIITSFLIFLNETSITDFKKVNYLFLLSRLV